MKLNTNFVKFLKRKVAWVQRETLKIHKLGQETRLASSLSPIQIFVVLYYGKILNFNPERLDWEQRDRFIVSKGHGAISLYPILADLGFFNPKELKSVCKNGSIFGSIPDTLIPGIETINGSLGHGLGVGCGMALGLKRKKINSNVFVLTGDGELYEGAIWEAVMFAAHHKLSNLILIVDNNRVSMLDYCKNIIDLSPLEDKFRAFRWKTRVVNGHNIKDVYTALTELKKDKGLRPKVLIANTKKGKGIRSLETDPLCHIKSLSENEVNAAIKKYDELI